MPAMAAMQGERDVNAQVSDALLRSRLPPEQVELLTSQEWLHPLQLFL
jgi:hypothetical protein